MYHYHWFALFNNGVVLEQFDGDTERKFSDVMDRVDDLKEFSLISTDGKNRTYKVDLETGDMDLDNQTVPSFVKDLKKYNPKPIFWRRNQVHLFSVSGPEVVGYILGWQANVDGINKQIQFMVLPDGKVELIEKIGNSNVVSAKARKIKKIHI